MFSLGTPFEQVKPFGEGPSSQRKWKTPDTNLVHISDEEGSRFKLTNDPDDLEKEFKA